MDKIEVLQQMIDESEKIEFFGGAGVSTESGIRLQGVGRYMSCMAAFYGTIARNAENSILRSIF